MVSLIITIIVMVILAAVALVFTTSDEGIIKKAQDSLANSEREETYEKVGTSLLHKEDGKINVKDSFEAIENNLDQNVTLIAPSSEGEIGNEIIFTVEGKYETYKFKLTQTELIIIKDGTIENPKTEPDLQIKQYYEGDCVSLEIIPNLTYDLFTEQEACKRWLGVDTVAEALTININDLIGTEFENFEELAAEFRNEEGFIDIGSIESDGGSGSDSGSYSYSGSDSGSESDEITIEPFVDEYEGMKNIIALFLYWDEAEVELETIQEYVSYMYINEYDDVCAETKILKINGRTLGEDEFYWDGGYTASYDVYEMGTYEIEMQLDEMILKGSVTIDRLENYVGKKVYYSGINWTVIYDDVEHGIQMVSDNPLGDGVTFGGYETVEEAIEEYNKVNATLTAECSRLVTDKSKVTNIRNIGGLSEDNDRYLTMDDIEDEWFEQYAGKIMTSDNTLDGYYEKDNRMLVSLGISDTTDKYWFSNRTYSSTSFKIRAKSYQEYIMIFTNGQYFKQDPKTYKVRPVITIDPDCKLEKVSGNEDIYSLTK